MATLALPLGSIGPAARAQSVRLPEIISGPTNMIPACTTPNRLMEFITNRNRGLRPPREIDRRFSDIAFIYKSVGECVEKVDGRCIGIRWDYAFYQTLIETNYLNFTGGVRIEDNNFAGIGATIAGKPGERFASVRDGVLAHLQHVLMYAGVTIRNPMARRTRVVQSEVHRKMRELGRPVTFSDLATLWTGSDKDVYAASIERTWQNFSRGFCGG